MLLNIVLTVPKSKPCSNDNDPMMWVLHVDSIYIFPPENDQCINYILPIETHTHTHTHIRNIEISSFYKWSSLKYISQI